jgi:hypothetical protein
MYYGYKEGKNPNVEFDTNFYLIITMILKIKNKLILRLYSKWDRR